MLQNCYSNLWLYFHSINPVVVERFLDRTEYFLDKYKVPSADDGPRSIPSRIMGMCELLNFGPSPLRAAAANAAATAAFNGQTFVDRYRRVRRAYSIVMRAVSCLLLTARSARVAHGLSAEVGADDFFVKWSVTRCAGSGDVDDKRCHSWGCLNYSSLSLRSKRPDFLFLKV